MLEYVLDIEPSERTIVQQCYRSGVPIPDRIQNAPELIDGLELYLSAFFDLDSERSHGMAPTPIPFTSIVKYAEVFGFDLEQTEALLIYVRELDKFNLDRIVKNSKTK